MRLRRSGWTLSRFSDALWGSLGAHKENGQPVMGWPLCLFPNAIGYFAFLSALRCSAHRAFCAAEILALAEALRGLRFRAVVVVGVEFLGGRPTRRGAAASCNSAFAFCSCSIWASIWERISVKSMTAMLTRAVSVPDKVTSRRRAGHPGQRLGDG